MGSTIVKTLSVPIWILLALSLPAIPAEAAAQVRIVVNAEGRKVIYNEAPAQRARRYSSKLVDIPDASIQISIDRHSADQSLDPQLVRAMIQVESGYNHRARSHKGAMGLMQLMPGTAKQLRVSDPYDPDENVRGGTQYLRHLVDRFSGRLDLAVAAYNAGPGAV
ncbi:MAG TPA: lytic transglycosylase domain-containing protein, partial [Thermoanaerobaculia bacterium]|nr:lytic transglycosylase domain-containing protein [Thermoanaerobaculia bacterium]